MKKFAIAHAYEDGDVVISFVEGKNKFEALVKYAKDEDYEFSSDDYCSIDELKYLFGDCDQSIEIKEIPQ